MVAQTFCLSQLGERNRLQAERQLWPEALVVLERINRCMMLAPFCERIQRQVAIASYNADATRLLPTEVAMLIRSMLIAAIALSLAIPAYAQRVGSAEKVGKMYKWKDEAGNIHYTDTIPPEAKDLARESLNQDGISVERVERAMTEEEKAARAAAEAKAAEEARVAEEARKRDQVLLNSYASEDDLTRGYKQRMDLLEQSIEARKIEIGAREQSLSTLVAQAADLERSGKVVSEALKQMITSERTEIDRQKGFIKEKEAEKITAKKDYDRDLAVYRAAVARNKAAMEAAKAQ